MISFFLKNDEILEFFCLKSVEFIRCIQWKFEINSFTVSLTNNNILFLSWFKKSLKGAIVNCTDWGLLKIMFSSKQRLQSKTKGQRSHCKDIKKDKELSFHCKIIDLCFHSWWRTTLSSSSQRHFYLVIATDISTSSHPK